MAGLLLLVPPTRAVARPVLAALAVRGLGRRAPLATVRGYATERPRDRGDFIDGEVIDVVDGPPPTSSNG